MLVTENTFTKVGDLCATIIMFLGFHLFSLQSKKIKCHLLNVFIEVVGLRESFMPRLYHGL